MNAKIPKSGRKKLVPILIVILALALIGVVLAFVIPAINKGKKSDNSDSISSSETESSSESSKDSSDNSGEPDSKKDVIDSSSDSSKNDTMSKYDDHSGDEFNLIIKDTTPIRKENFNKRFGKDDATKKKIEVYNDEYTNYKINMFYNFISGLSALKTNSPEMLKVYSETNTKWNPILESGEMPFTSLESGIPIPTSLASIEYANFIYNHAIDGLISYDLFASELENNKDPDNMLCFKIKTDSLESVFENVNFFYSFVNFASKDMNADWDSHSFEFGAVSAVDENSIPKNSVPKSCKVKYAVPVKDLTAKLDIICLFDANNNLINVSII